MSEKKSEKTIKKLSVLLTAELHFRAKREALLSDQSLTDLIVELLSNYLDEAEKAREAKPD